MSQRTPGRSPRPQRGTRLAARLWQLDLAALLFVLAGLLLPYRKFFPISQVAA